MILGKEFNELAIGLLKLPADGSDMKSDRLTDVCQVSVDKGLDKTDSKNLLEYLESKHCLEIQSIGNPYLYAEVVLTNCG